MHDEVYNWGSFAQSRMYASGVTCSDCHDPHSLKLTTAAGANTNGVCAQCHQPAKYDAVAHTHHATGTPGAACAACHMPTTTYMQVDPRHDHSMRIPRPDVSAKLGMPNACNNCHTKQTPQWSADAIATWTGKPPASFQNFAAALNDGTRATPAARGELLALIQDKAQPVIVRASAIQRLGPLITPATLPTLAQALNDPDPVVRLAAVEALSGTAAEMRQRYVPRMLDDPVLAVRIEAARILGAAGGRALTAAQRPAFDKALAQYMQVQTYNADRPEGQTSLGNVYAQGDNPEAAIAAFRKAIELDPTFVPAYTNLADLYRARGADGEAVATLRAGIARNPRAGTLYHVLGLALIRQKQTADGVKALATAAQLTPANARFAYVYAVALNDSGRVGEAMQVLHAALKREPYDRDVLSGLAFFSARSGDRESARRYVAQLRELDPENTEYERMAKSVEGAPSPTAR
jgi:predicted CXXCH cytochrome family protein